MKYATPVFPLLVGAAAGILQARVLMAVRKGRRTTRPMLEAVNLTSLGQDFAAAVGPDGVAWNQSDGIALWGAGFFLNKAQVNLTVALDKCVNAWLKTKLEADAGNAQSWSAETSIDSLFEADLSARLVLLRALVTSDVRDSVEHLRKEIQQYGSGEAAADILALQTKKFRRGHEGDVDSIYRTLRFGRHQALAIVAGRVAVFEKYLRRPERVGIGFPLEIALTAKALTDGANLWRAMLADTNGHLTLPTHRRAVKR